METVKIHRINYKPQDPTERGWSTTFNGESLYWYGNIGTKPSLEQVIRDELTKLGNTSPVEFVRS